MMTDGAACRGAEHAVVAGEVTGDAADGCAIGHHEASKKANQNQPSKPQQ